MMPKTRLPIKNMVLAALPHKEYDRMLPDLEFISLPLDVSLYKSGDAIEYVLTWSNFSRPDPLARITR